MVMKIKTAKVKEAQGNASNYQDQIVTAPERGRGQGKGLNSDIGDSSSTPDEEIIKKWKKKKKTPTKKDELPERSA